MTSIRTGSTAFGRVNVPVKAHGASEGRELCLQHAQGADNRFIRYQRRYEVFEKKVGYDDINKAHDAGGRTVSLTGEYAESLPAEKSREIEVAQLVANGQINPMMFERSHHLESDSKSPQASALLVKTLENTELPAAVIFALRQESRPGAPRVRGRGLWLQRLLWGDEMRDTEFMKTRANATISARKPKMPSALVEHFRGVFEPGGFSGDYQLEPRTDIGEKLEQGVSLDTTVAFGESDCATESSDSGGGKALEAMGSLNRSIDVNRARIYVPNTGEISGISGLACKEVIRKALRPSAEAGQPTKREGIQRVRRINTREVVTRHEACSVQNRGQGLPCRGSRPEGGLVGV